jgi:hypothetical protein
VDRIRGRALSSWPSARIVGILTLSAISFPHSQTRLSSSWPPPVTVNHLEPPESAARSRAGLLCSWTYGGLEFFLATATEWQSGFCQKPTRPWRRGGRDQSNDVISCHLGSEDGARCESNARDPRLLRLHLYERKDLPGDSYVRVSIVYLDFVLFHSLPKRHNLVEIECPVALDHLFTRRTAQTQALRYAYARSAYFPTLKQGPSRVGVVQ